MIINACDLSTMHEKAVQHIMKYGYEVITEDGEDTLQCDPAYLKCSTPMDGDRLNKKFGLSEQFVNRYTDDILSGELNGFEYSYGDRLFNYHGVNQIEEAVNHLKNHPTTRRAIAITWKPEIDVFKKDVPCLQMIQFVNRGVLDMSVVFRSNDFGLALGANMYAMTTIQSNVAKTLDIPVGTYTHIAIVPHVYYIRDANVFQKLKW